MDKRAKLVKLLTVAAGNAWLVWLVVMAAVAAAKGVQPTGDDPICGPDCWPAL